MKRASLVLVMLFSCIVTGWPLSGAGASHADGTYDLPLIFRWEKVVLDVLVIPPNHGQIINGNGVLNGGDPRELTPFNSYLAAVEDSIADWDRAVSMFGAEWLKAGLQTNVYVVGRDTVPAAALQNPEIIVTSDETKGNILGVAVTTQPCLVDNSKFFFQSFTYEDMYSINAQEYGHCLGLEHVVENHPPLDAMAGIYTHTPGAKGNPLHCVSNLDVRGLEAVFGRLFGKPSPDTVSLPTTEYGTTCQPPGATAGGPAPSPTPSSVVVGPSPSPATSAAPSPSPTASSSPTPSPSPTVTNAHQHPRGVILHLRRHLVARGTVTTGDDSGECHSYVPVKVAKRKSGRWVTIATVTTTADGGYRTRVPDRAGRYRAVVAESTVGTHTCERAVSGVRAHSHR